MAGAYDDRDGVIWMDGEFVDWREAKVHVLSHALHYASSVFEGERAYNGKIFKAANTTSACSNPLNRWTCRCRSRSMSWKRRN